MKQTRSWISIPLIIIFAIAVGHLFSTASVPTSHNLDWNVSDVRMLDSLDAIEPSLDLIAAYSRSHEDLFQLRLDYLDIGPDESQTILVAIDNKPGGNIFVPLSGSLSISSDIAWDLLISVDGNNRITVLNAGFSAVAGAQARLECEPSMDMITINLRRDLIMGDSSFVNIQVFSLFPDATMGVADYTSVFSSDQVAAEHANVTLCFWNTFQSNTPAQALRSWDGAHAGPRSSRHGLRYLVEAAKLTQTPIVLWGLSTPSHHATLDYLGVLDTINEMESEKLLALPSSLSDVSVFCGNNAIELFGGNGYAQFETLSNNAPKFSLDLRRSLLGAAFLPETTMALGGDLSVSEWGVPGVALIAFEYINNHPWVRVASQGGANNNYDTPQMITYADNAILYELRTSPPNPLTDTAWGMMLDQLAAREPGEGTLPPNSVSYGLIGHMLAGAQWAESPYEKTDCTVDLDWDGEYECVLSNRQYFISIELIGGMSTFAFFLDASSGVHQIIGPTFQFTTIANLDDSSPIPGALYDIETMEVRYQVDALYPGTIVLISQDGMAIRKSFSLTPDGIRLMANNVQSSISIPLTLDPWQRFEAGWGQGYYAELSPSKIWTWSIRSGISVALNSPNPNTLRYFNVSQGTISRPEDPNRDYTAGHYLPFPMAVLDVQPSGGKASVDISIIP